jgi:hypothetical protein
MKDIRVTTRLQQSKTDKAAWQADFKNFASAAH